MPRSVPEADFLVIGSGVAGLRAALNSAGSGE
ncbi:MAG: FAD-binding protein [Nitrospira sp.]